MQFKNETAFNDHLVKKCNDMGLLVFHAKDSRKAVKTKEGKTILVGDSQMKGFPDLTIVGKKVIFRELKMDNTYATPAQRMWGERLLAAKADWAIWKPKHLDLFIMPELEALI